MIIYKVDPSHIAKTQKALSAIVLLHITLLN